MRTVQELDAEIERLWAERDERLQMKLAEIERLRAAVERLAKAGEEANNLYLKMSAEREALKAEIDDLRNFQMSPITGALERDLRADNERLRRDLETLRRGVGDLHIKHEAEIDRLQAALWEVTTNGYWTKGEQGGDWAIERNVYGMARDVLDPTRQGDKT